MAEADDDPAPAGSSSDPGRSGRLGEEADVWALTPARRVLHWALVVALVGAAVVVFRHAVAVPAGAVGTVGAVGFAVCAVLLAGREVRAVVAVWIDPADSSLILFRAVGGAVRTAPSRVRRIDHGWLDQYYRSPGARYLPTRIVTDHGTATLSMFLEAPEEIAEAIARRNPDTRVEL